MATLDSNQTIHRTQSRGRQTSAEKRSVVAASSNVEEASEMVPSPNLFKHVAKNSGMAVKFYVNGMRYTTGLLELRGKRFQSVEQYTAYLDAAKTHWEESVRSEEPEMMAKLIPKVCLTVGDNACLRKRTSSTFFNTSMT